MELPICKFTYLNFLMKKVTLQNFQNFCQFWRVISASIETLSHCKAPILRVFIVNHDISLKNLGEISQKIGMKRYLDIAKDLKKP
jgi:hypothetical protein